MGKEWGKSQKINMYYLVFICYPLIYNLSNMQIIYSCFLLTIVFQSKNNSCLTNVFCEFGKTIFFKDHLKLLSLPSWITGLFLHITSFSTCAMKKARPSKSSCYSDIRLFLNNWIPVFFIHDGYFNFNLMTSLQPVSGWYLCVQRRKNVTERRQDQQPEGLDVSLSHHKSQHLGSSCSLWLNLLKC